MTILKLLKRWRHSFMALQLAELLCNCYAIYECKLCLQNNVKLSVEAVLFKMGDRRYSSFVQQQKYVFNGPVPFGFSSCGRTNQPLKSSILNDFTSNYRKRLSTEWAPVTVSRADPPLLIQPTAIYHKHIGQLPNYGGHIPGKMFRFGKTYGNDTRDAKRWLRGDFSS